MRDKYNVIAQTLLTGVIIVLAIWMVIFQNKYNKVKDELIHYKTIVETANNTIKRDSIIYNIQYKDSTIVRIKKEYKDEIEYVKRLDDSESVVMFNKLVWSD